MAKMKLPFFPWFRDVSSEVVVEKDRHNRWSLKSEVTAAGRPVKRWSRPSFSYSRSDEACKKQHRLSFSGFRRSVEPEAATSTRNETSPLLTPTSANTPTSPTTCDRSVSPSSSMVELARRITAESEKLESYMRDHNLPLPGFDLDAPDDYPKLPEEVLKSRHDLISATNELGMLAHGPRESLRFGVWAFLDVLALQAIMHHGMPKLWPVDETIALDELQSRTRLDPINLARLLRTAMTQGIFAEHTPGIISHTAASRLLAQDADLAAWIGFNAEDIFPAAAHMLQALEAHPEATSLTRTGFNYAFGTVDKEPMFTTFSRDPARAQRMGRAMASLTGGEGYELSYLVDVHAGGYDLSAVDAAGGTLVDVGGSHGFVCVELARRYRRMRFVVQDLPRTIDSAPRPVCGDDDQVNERIIMQAHDFFTEQPVRGADVYFLRWILHNYSTPYAVQVLRALVPALKPGARVVVNDHCLREPGREDAWDERVMRRMDLVMGALLNAQERTEAEFRDLFARASKGFRFVGVTRAPGCRMSVIEAVWEPQNAHA